MDQFSLLIIMPFVLVSTNSIAQQSSDALQRNRRYQALAAPAAPANPEPKPIPSHNNTVITFSGQPFNTHITDQYKNLGIVFGGDQPFVSGDDAFPTSPVLVGTPRYQGSMTGYFVDPTSGAPSPVDGFRMDVGYLNDTHSVQLVWYGRNGNPIGSISNAFLGIRNYQAKAKFPIYSWSISIVGAEDAGFSIDNIAFDVAQTPCGDERDNIISEYSDYGVSLRPTCQNFTQSAHSASYAFSEFNTGDFSYALIRAPLVAPYPEAGLESWIANIGERHSINSAYRNPARNAGAHGKPGSRHQFGDAVDLKNNSRTEEEHDELQAAALDADADYVEPITLACRLGCVHADWRNHAGPYVQ